MRTIIVVFLCVVFFAHCNDRRHPRAKTVGVDTGKNIPESIAISASRGKRSVKSRIPGAFPPQVAGSFYPADPAVLKKQVRGFLADAKPGEDLQRRDIVGVLAPHAGYRYSGPIAGRAYGQLSHRSETTNTVIILALSHRKVSVKASILDAPAYETPLGSLELDRKIIDRLLLKHGDLFERTREVFQGEHSLEVQLPFVQIALPEAEIVPIIVAVHDDRFVSRIGRALHDVVRTRKDVVFVVSSDLSHFLSYEEATRIDDETLGFLETWKIPAWKKAAIRQSEGMCGYRPMLAFVSMFEKYPARSRLVSRIAYQNSGDTRGGNTTGDKSRVVGYGAIAFSLEKNMRTEEQVKKDFGPLSSEQRRYLMDLAKASVKAAASGRNFDPPEPTEELLTTNGAAFVTLKKTGQLRGCIGHVVARVPLYLCVSDVARAAAIHDTRFNPVGEEDLAGLTYEISVLTPPIPIKPEEVEIGKHGLIMTRGPRSGLLLPQVPVEWGWNRSEFLAHTCRKAGLPLDCWKQPDTKIESFQAIVFGEDDLEDE